MNKAKRQFLALIFLLIFHSHVYAGQIESSKAVRAIIGEAGNQGYQGMLAVACAIRNRKTLNGVYGLNAKHVDKEPQWIFDMARKAWQESKHNRIHSGDHWGSKICDQNWIKTMEKKGFIKVYIYKDHIFYKHK